VASPSLDELHRATEEAKNAAAAARAATAALEEHVREREARYSRNGLYLSGGVFYAPELFDTSLSVLDSRGLYGALGYHFGERVEVEARFEAIDDFLLGSAPLLYYGTFYGWTGTLNARVFLLTKSFQPYIGMGIGVIDAKTRLTDGLTGVTYRYDDTEALFRVSGGFDFYVSETLALTADAAINMPGGELSGANYATLGGGIKLRF
jgi:opacity protein-like surface antigen